MKKIWAVILLIQLAAIQSAFGWGSYAHQQVNTAAVTLFYEAKPENGLASCLHTNAELIQRLAITPDYDWKMVGKSPTDKEAIKARSHADRFEHSLHYFEADAFEADPTAIPRLPSGDYDQVLPEYIKRISQRADYVALIDPSKKLKDKLHPTTKEVAAHGTAPWRIRQMYNLGVLALKHYQSNPKRFPLGLALTYLGAMGHYVGDMSQPFHATLNFDGEYDPPFSPSPAAGIHSGFETEMFNLFVGNSDPIDTNDFTYANFDKTERPVLAAARSKLGSKGLNPIPADQIIPQVFHLIAEGFPYIQNLVRNFATEVLKARGQNGSLNNKETERKISSGSSTLDSKSMTVLEFSEKRIGESSALLATLWLSAYEDAGSPDIAKCDLIPFDRNMVIKSYIVPTYLPPPTKALKIIGKKGPLAISKEVKGEPKPKSPPTAAIRAFTNDTL